jgi:predicted nucleic acid-binding protein
VIRAVFDANVIAAAFPSSFGTLRELIDRWWNQECELVVSEHIIAEVERAWAKPY